MVLYAIVIYLGFSPALADEMHHRKAESSLLLYSPWKSCSGTNLQIQSVRGEGSLTVQLCTGWNENKNSKSCYSFSSPREPNLIRIAWVNMTSETEESTISGTANIPSNKHINKVWLMILSPLTAYFCKIHKPKSD